MAAAITLCTYHPRAQRAGKLKLKYRPFGFKTTCLYIFTHTFIVIIPLFTFVVSQFFYKSSPPRLSVCPRQASYWQVDACTLLMVEVEVKSKSVGDEI